LAVKPLKVPPHLTLQRYSFDRANLRSGFPSQRYALENAPVSPVNAKGATRFLHKRAGGLNRFGLGAMHAERT
jgi:hypothetical protein